MYRHLTCSEIFWHFSDKRILTISNPEWRSVTKNSDNRAGSNGIDIEVS